MKYTIKNLKNDFPTDEAGEVNQGSLSEASKVDVDTLEKMSDALIPAQDALHSLEAKANGLSGFKEFSKGHKLLMKAVKDVQKALDVIDKSVEWDWDQK